MTTKVLKIDSITCRVEIINVNQWGEDHFENLVQTRIFAKDIQLGLIQGQASSHLQLRVILYHVELNT